VRKVKVTRRGEGYDIHIGGGIVDATSLFSGTGDAESKAAAKEAKAVPAAARTYTPLVLSSGKLDRLEFGPDRYFEEVSLDFDRGTSGWNRLEMTGNVPRALWSQSPPKPAATTTTAPGSAPVPEPPRSLRIEFGPIPAGVHKLSVTAEDMGGVLRALDIADTVQGGTLDVTGSSDGPLPARPLNARIEARNYVLVNAPILASLLTVASLTGIVDLLRGDGITFTHLTGDVILDDGVLTTDLVRAYGPALGLTVKGNLDFDESVADLQGTIVPAYTINRVLGYIPLLGQILVGGEGEGFLAFTYKITGPLAKPEVNVNALSALAPGFLRGLFGLLDAQGAASEENQPRAFPDRESP
jgi:hypothetical protein